MSFFDEIFEKLFPKNQNAHLPFLTEQITRSDRFILGYQKWLLKRNFFLKEIHQGVMSKKNALINSEIRCEILEMDAAQGFVVYFHPSMEKNDFICLFEFFKDKIKDLGYKKMVSDRKIYTQKEFVETIERYYLKPKLHFIDEKQDQKFGNLLLELHFCDDEPLYLKVLATIYSDANFQKAEKFDNLLPLLFEN